MKQKKYTYPVFKKKQILSDSDLNKSFEYLEEQTRLTRANLIGTGIVCGLRPSWSEDNKKISITNGYGITTDGHLIVEDAEGQEKNLQFLQKDVDIIINGKEITCIELFKDKPSDDTKDINESILNGKILLLYLNISEELEDNSPCSNEGKGGEVKSTVRYLLINKTQNLIKEPLKNDDKSSQLERVLMRRILFSSDVNLNKEGIKNSFDEKTKEAAQSIKNALDNVYGLFQLFLIDKYPRNPFDEIITEDAFLKALFKKNPHDLPSIDGDYFQNYYDFFDDLLKAYEEFRQKGQELLQQYNPTCFPERIFPNYLILGTFTLPTGTGKIKFVEDDRHFFRSSLTASCIKKLRWLFDRLVKMINCFDLEGGSEELIRLAPSKLGDFPLSDKAVPYYYDISIHDIWEYNNTKKIYKEDDLKNDLEKHNFIRIEGHINQEYKKNTDTPDIKERIKNYVKTYRIPIEVISLYAHNVISGDSTQKILNNNVTFSNSNVKAKGAQFLRKSLNSFLKRHPGIQHKAGVPLGGTFIIVYEVSISTDDDLLQIHCGNVIADFFLPYHCCSNYVPPLALNIDSECNNSQKVFRITIPEHNNTLNYFYRIDNNNFLPVPKENGTSILILDKLHEGIHEITVCDSEGTESAKHMLNVPKPLTIGQPSYKDISDEEYTVSFDISGGTLPYNQKNYINYSNGKYTYSRNRKSTDNDTTVTIRDTNNCSKQITLPAHTICKLPCQGQSKRCAYRLWLQKPTNDEKITEYTRIGEVQLYFKEQKIHLPNSESLLQLSVKELTKDNFDSAVSCAVKRLNDVINQALSFAGFGNDRLLLQYKPDDQKDPFSILWIEYFDCEDETFSIEFSILGQADVRTIYRNNNVIIDNITVPSFDHSTHDRYNDVPEPNGCAPFSIKISGMQSGNNSNQYSFSGEVLNESGEGNGMGNIIAWVWDFPETQTGQPFYSQLDPVILDQQLDNSDNMIRLTAITNDGCFTTVNNTFKDVLSDNNGS
jgi:hypothetical protein